MLRPLPDDRLPVYPVIADPSWWTLPGDLLGSAGTDTLCWFCESAEAETAEVSAEFEGLEDVAPDSGGEEFGDSGSADGG
jgi:hypothetical protein